MKDKFKLIKRLILFFIGMVIIQIGVALFLKSDLGSDPFTVFNQGLGFLLNITPGNANRIILVVLTIIIFFANKKYINIGTIICVFGVGPIIDSALKMCSSLDIASYNILIKMCLLVLVSFIIAIGFSILSATNLGFAPNDSVYFIIGDKTKIEYRWVRMITDLCYLLIGFLLGGVVGIGTIISALLTGPFVQLCLPYGTKFVNGIIENKNIKKQAVN